ncbi:MAG: hypothetical protein F6K62_26445, partial [Sphaerospermopsis sp. SIO1G2]|nr:hypothetical protein [Sphaerospermopsis sp. SIO1G2]
LVITNITYNNYDQQRQNNWRNGGRNIEGQPINSIKTGSVGYAHLPEDGWEDGNLPRRIAFKRDINTGELTTPLEIYGVNNRNKIASFAADGSELPKPAKDENGNTYLIPWLIADNNGNWQPVLQIKQPFATPENPNNNDSISPHTNNNWLQKATANTFNLIIATGDTPGRPNEDNGGLSNLVRYLENWHDIPLTIDGAFIQTKKSAYSTGSYKTSTNLQGSEFLYSITLNDGMSSGHFPPQQQWNYDVGLILQTPDLFSQKLVTTSSKPPSEYFREVSRGDKWIKTLLCAININGGYAIDTDQRPNC